jgi:hypothetical protein
MPDDTAIAEAPPGPYSAAALVGNANQRPDTGLEHRIDIECTHFTSGGARYRVEHMGQTLIESARDPEFDTCRALLARGVRGTLAIYSPGSSVPRMRVDIEVGAKLTSIDNATKGPRIGRYRPRPNSVERNETE